MPGSFQIVTGLLLAILISIVSFKVRFLTAGGAATQALLGWVVFGFGGWSFAVPILVFFISSSLLSMPRNHRTSRQEDVSAKGSTRDALQVLVNGGAGSLIVVCNLMLKSDLWYLAYAGSFAAAATDTWGTEVGVRSGSVPRLLTTFRAVEPGRSGGVTLAGTFGGFAGGTLVGLSSLAWAPSPAGVAIVCIVWAGLAGSTVDSLLGCTVQVQYRCLVCDRITERTAHCGSKSVVVGGVRWITNDMVNLACTIVGLVVAPLAFWILR